MPPETEVKEEIQEEVIEEKTQEQMSKDMYPDDVKEEAKEETKEESKKEETEDKAGDKTKEESQEKDEETGEQEETEKEEAEAITLSLSKDSPLTEDQLTNLTEFAKENELPQDLAQLMLAREVAAASSFAEKQESDLQASLAEGYKVIENHPVYGGENLEKAQLVANRPLEKYGNEAITEALTERKLINDPAIFEFMHKLGLAMGDDQFVKGDQIKEKKKISRAHAMYPNEAPQSTDVN